MAQYELESLIDWVRRDGGDVAQSYQETLEPDGTRRVAINNDGSIRLRLVERDDVEIEEGTDFELSGSNLVFENPVPEDTTIYVEYSQSTYSDDDILNFLLDAARRIGADLASKWTVDDEDFIIEDDGTLFDDSENPSRANSRIEKLIVMAAAIAIAQDKAKNAADDSINIKDGDTSIATGENSKAQERRLERMNTDFNREMNYARANRFTGASE